MMNEPEKQGAGPSTPHWWCKFDKFIVLMCFFCASRLHDWDNYTDHKDWQTLKVFIMELSVLSVTIWLAIKVLKVWNPATCHYTPDPFTTIYVQKVNTKPTKGQRNRSESYTQTDEPTFLIETKRIEKLHQREMRRLQRELSLFRRKCSEKLKETKDVLDNRRQQLSDEQLKLLPLASRKDVLLKEKGDIEQLLMEETRRNQDLMERFSKLNRQLSSSGAALFGNDVTSMQMLRGDRGDGEDCAIENDHLKDLFQRTKHRQHYGRMFGATNEVLTEDTEAQTQTANTHGDTDQPELPRLNIKTDNTIPPVRILYAAERGTDGAVRYLQVTPDMYSEYETGKCLPGSSVGQMEVIAEPLPDGTLRLIDVQKFSDGFPKIKLQTQLKYQTFEEFRTRVGLPVPDNWTPDQVKFQTL